mgnify:CR=1 FL=1
MSLSGVAGNTAVPAQRRDCRVDGRIDGGARVRRGRRRGPKAQPLAQGDHIVQGHAALPVSGREMLGKPAHDRRVGACHGGGQPICEGFGIGEQLAQGEVAVAAAEVRVGVNGPLECPRREASRGSPDSGRVGGMAGGQVSGWETERWVAHEAEV